MVRLWLNNFLFFMRHSSLHTAEKLVILERWSLWLRFIGIRIWEKPFESFGRIGGPVAFFQVSNCAFRGSTGVPRQCFGAPDLLEQQKNGLEKSNHRLYKGEEKKEASSGPNVKNSLFFGSGAGAVSFLPMMFALEMEY